MISINLLPWRENLRKEQLKEFLFVLWVFVGSVVGCMVAVHLCIHSKIHAQQAFNSHLQHEVVLFNEKIQDINGLLAEKDFFLKRMTVIQMLQSSRSSVVHLFDELGSLLPHGMYLTAIKRNGKKVSIYGRAESNKKISVLMRHVERSSWLANPVLEEIKNANKPEADFSKNKKKNTLNNFKLIMEEIDKTNGF